MRISESNMAPCALVIHNGCVKIVDIYFDEPSDVLFIDDSGELESRCLDYNDELDAYYCTCDSGLVLNHALQVIETGEEDDLDASQSLTIPGSEDTITGAMEALQPLLKSLLSGELHPSDFTHYSMIVSDPTLMRQKWLSAGKDMMSAQKTFLADRLSKFVF